MFRQLKPSACTAVLVMLSAWTVIALGPTEQGDIVAGKPAAVSLQAFNRTTGLAYTPTKGLKSARNVTRPGYRIARTKADQVRNLGAPGVDITDQQLSLQGCNTDSVESKDCLDVLLLALTPSSYSSNNTRDTPSRRALISPAQNQGSCSACVGFAATAAAEAAVNVYRQQQWNSVGLSEQDFSFCSLPIPVDCIEGAEYEVVTAAVKGRQIKAWADRTCFAYEQQPPRSCGRVEQRGDATICPSQLPPGGEFSMAYGGSPLQSMAQVKEQIMLAGGVLTSLTMSESAFKLFDKYNSSGVVFDTDETLEQAADLPIYRHAVFCYGWWDNPKDAGDGYWLCKNSWGTDWGQNGAFKIAYGAAYSMQTDYTFALRFAAPNIVRVQGILQSFNATAAYDTSKPGCVLITPRTPQRLLHLADNLTALDDLERDALGPARVFADVVASNLGFLPTALSASSRGPFRLCGKVVKLLRGVLPLVAPPASPSPAPSPSPVPPRCLDPNPGTLPTRRAGQPPASRDYARQASEAPVQTAQLPKACAQSNMTGPDPKISFECADAMMLALMPSKYSSNSTADTPGGHAFISPAKDQGACAASVSFAVTAAAEAAINVYKQQSWSKLSLSEQEFGFCKLQPRMNCRAGASYSDVISTFATGYVTSWASRDCSPYKGVPDGTCASAAKDCPSQLPPGGSLELAYQGNWIEYVAQIKEQIILSGGVLTALAATEAFVKYNATSTVFSTSKDPPVLYGLQPLFCYGWWDNPCYAGEGYWLCKNSWGQDWGINGSVKVAYGSAYIMQPDYTFALQYNKPISERGTEIRQKLKPALTRDTAMPKCVVYRPRQPQRLVKLVADLHILGIAEFDEGRSYQFLNEAVILADVVTPNLGLGRNLSAARRGPFRICGKTAELLRAAVCQGSC